jgi:Permuted papain-like amidase enzyme, YaeF/YiiX, C92 family
MKTFLFYLRRLLIRIILPITKIVGKLSFYSKRRDIQIGEWECLKEVLELGDVLLTLTKGELTNFFIPGEYKHCGLYAGSDKVIEATGKGVSVTNLEDFCYTKDKIAVCRSRFCKNKDLLRVVKYARDLRGSPYDYYFEPNEDAFYCAELIAAAFNHGVVGMSPFTTRDMWGVETVLPSDFKNAIKKFEVVLEVP